MIDVPPLCWVAVNVMWSMVIAVAAAEAITCTEPVGFCRLLEQAAHTKSTQAATAVQDTRIWFPLGYWRVVEICTNGTRRFATGEVKLSQIARPSVVYPTAIHYPL